MSGSTSGDELTARLRAVQRGDREAEALVFATVEQALRSRGCQVGADRAHNAEQQLTTLVHDVFLRVVRGQRARWQNRAHFLAVAAMTMRRMLVDLARAARRQRRGGGLQQEPLVEDLAAHLPDPDFVLTLHDAIAAIARDHPRWGQVAELRLFGGRNHHEIAADLGVSLRTVEQDWRYVRARLSQALSAE